MKDLLNLAIDFEEFEEGADQEHKERMQKWFNNGIDNGLKQQIIDLKDEYHIFAISELWCPDCVINDVALMHLHALSSNIHIHVFNRDVFKHESMLKLLEGYEQRIPTFIVLDNEYNKMGVFVERPSNVRSVEASSDQVKKIVTMKAYRNGEYIERTVEDLLEMMKGN